MESQISNFKSQISVSPEKTFEIAEEFGKILSSGDVILLNGDLGAGKTLFTKGILSALDYDVDEVTSPSFTLVNLYETPEINVYHIDLWRLGESMNPGMAVGLNEILEEENFIVIIEWPERLGDFSFDTRVFNVELEGDGDDPRKIEIGVSA